MSGLSVDGSHDVAELLWTLRSTLTQSRSGLLANESTQRNASLQGLIDLVQQLMDEALDGGQLGLYGLIDGLHDELADQLDRDVGFTLDEFEYLSDVNELMLAHLREPTDKSTIDRLVEMKCANSPWSGDENILEMDEIKDLLVGSRPGSYTPDRDIVDKDIRDVGVNDSSNRIGSSTKSSGVDGESGSQSVSHDMLGPDADNIDVENEIQPPAAENVDEEKLESEENQQVDIQQAQVAQAEAEDTHDAESENSETDTDLDALLRDVDTYNKMAADADDHAYDQFELDESSADTRIGRRDDPAGEQEGVADNELIQLLSVQIDAICVLRDELGGLLTASTSSPQEIRTLLERYADEADNLSRASQIVGFFGFSSASGYIAEQLGLLVQSGSDDIVRVAAVIQVWPSALKSYLVNGQSVSDCRAIVDLLTDSRWPSPMTDEAVEKVLENLIAAEVAGDDEDDSTGMHTQDASAEDLSLQIPDTVDKYVLDGLFSELPEQTSEYSVSINNFVSGEGSPEDLANAQRVAHTLKGAASVVGIVGIANLTHHLEDILEAHSTGDGSVSEELKQLLVDSADCLEAMTDALLNGRSEAPDGTLEIYHHVIAASQQQKSGGDSKRSFAPLAAAGRSAPSNRSDKADNDDAEPTPDAGKPHMLRVSPRLVDELLRITGDSIIATGLGRESLKGARESLRGLLMQTKLIQRYSSELEELVTVKGSIGNVRKLSVSGNFDSLEMDHYDELNTFNSKLAEASADAQELSQRVDEHLRALEDFIVSQERLNRENQETVISARMVRMKMVLPRLQRGVRQVCRSTGKRATLEMVGDDTLIDGGLLNHVVDPLMHILRNAVDHGIELPEERERAGKKPVGSIRMEVIREGDKVVIRCADDGRGLNFETIKRTAAELGFVRADQRLGEDDLARLILLPGFSTRKDVSHISGRGIGMDIVHARVQEMKGELNIKSEKNRGTTIEMSLPLTLIASHVLLIRVGEDVYAVSNRGIEEILSISGGTIKRLGNELMFRLGDESYEVIQLPNLIGRATDSASLDKYQAVLLVRNDAGVRVAVLVEELLSSGVVVVKSLGKFVPKVQGVIGATILGTGRVTPVLDIAEFLRVPLVEQFASVSLVHDAAAQEREGLGPAPSALVVDDSVTARRVLSKLVESSGYEVLAAKDGLEAIAILEDHVPDIMFVDMEMPRMNGLELTHYVRGNDILCHVPVVMVTSRSTNKHRKEAQEAGVDAYLSKPFDDKDVMAQLAALEI